jgi:hypothetical protein
MCPLRLGYPNNIWSLSLLRIINQRSAIVCRLSSVTWNCHVIEWCSVLLRLSMAESLQPLLGPELSVLRHPIRYHSRIGVTK